MLELNTFADMFAGCGGLSYGFHESGMQCITATDNWVKALEVYQRNFEGANVSPLDLRNDADVKKLIATLKGKVDVLLGGPPCQGFSTLGKRKEDCNKSILLDSYLNIAVEVSPKIIVMENVRGVLSKKHPYKGTFENSIHDILRKNFHYEHFLINALDFGLAQTRTRFVLVAVRKDLDRSENLLKEICANIENLKEDNHKVLRDVLEGLPLIGPCEGEDVYRYKGKTFYNHKAMNHSDALQKRFSFVPPGGGLLDVPIELLTPHLKKMVRGQYGSGGHVKNIYGRLEWSKPCGTIIAGMDKITCGRYLHPERDRLLTPRECARIQSFPDSFIFEGSLVNQYYMIGNAVPPKISSVLALAIQKAAIAENLKAAA